MEDENNWLVGVDWASQTHHVRLSDAKGAKIGERAFAHGGEGLKEMADWILKSTGAAPEAVMVAIEVPHGPVVESLMERGFQVYAINPKQLDRFRDRFSPAGAKDDSRDAEALADALLTDRRCFRLLAPLDPVVVELRKEQRDVTILRSLPGVGRIVLATLLAEAQDALRRRDYHALRCLSGVAPITKRSGKSKIVLMRQAAHVRLRNAVYHWARTAVQHDPRSRAKYAALRTRGHGHGRALRSVAVRLLAVACAMLKSRTLFNPNLSIKINSPSA